MMMMMDQSNSSKKKITVIEIENENVIISINGDEKMIRDQFDDFHINHDDLYIQFCVHCNLLRDQDRNKRGHQWKSIIINIKRNY